MKTPDTVPWSQPTVMASFGQAGDRILEAMTVTAVPEPVPARRSDEDVSAEELMRRQGVVPIESLRDLAHPDLWDSDEDYEQFLANLYASRRLGMA